MNVVCFEGGLFWTDTDTNTQHNLQVFIESVVSRVDNIYNNAPEK